MGESANNIDSFKGCEDKELLNEYLDTIVKRDDLMLKKQIYLDAKHICMSYDLMKIELMSKINVKKLKIENNMIKSSIKLDRRLNEEILNNLIRRETVTLKNQIMAIDDLLKTAKEYIIDYEKDENYKNEIRKLYKKMILRISPTFNHLDSNKQKLWEKTELAYIYNNLNLLKVLSNLLNEEHIPTKKYSREELVENIHQLNEEIKSMENLYPFNIDCNIDDKIYIESYRCEIKERIQEIKEEEKYLYREVDLLKKKINSLNFN
ncbi:hypothetical protein EAI30_05680 [Romboutsia ilealis]|uniref:DUF4041 domain-containing protein n=1 Tax=Romboutsia faecis TaxID=2764597 RepID=A0ABR7JPP7_9FIRM|nr:hypothetical protein [Romboutsia faecis]MBC5996576.1 hypothetical protein [Romboutsia faecis]MRN24101.1 hypothetical protein [Romboutsia ilealis]